MEMERSSTPIQIDLSDRTGRPAKRFRSMIAIDMRFAHKPLTASSNILKSTRPRASRFILQMKSVILMMHWAMTATRSISRPVMISPTFRDSGDAVDVLRMILKLGMTTYLSLGGAYTPQMNASRRTTAILERLTMPGKAEITTAWTKNRSTAFNGEKRKRTVRGMRNSSFRRTRKWLNDANVGTSTARSLT